MARKKEEVIDKKVREKITNEVLEEINTNIKDELCKSVIEDVKNSIDEEYKNDLKKDISNELIIDIKDEIKKEQKKLIRRKNFKIFRLYIYIILLILVAVFAIYRLYETGNLEVLKQYEVVKKSETTTKKNELVKDFNWYYTNYAYLLDNVKITNYELLKSEYTIDKIDITDKLAMSYKIMDPSLIANEGIIYSFKESDIKNAFIKIFGDDENYSGVNFTVDGLSYAYSANNQSFIAISANRKGESNIVNYIENIQENNGRIIITSKVALIKENNIYNIFDLNKVIGKYNVKEGIKDFSSDLSTVDYIFELKNDNYYISSIVKK